jgi:hypothetical protein
LSLPFSFSTFIMAPINFFNLRVALSLDGNSWNTLF